MKYIKLSLLIGCLFAPSAFASQVTALTSTMSELSPVLEAHDIEVKYPTLLLFNADKELVKVIKDDKASGYRSQNLQNDSWNSDSHASGLTLSDFPSVFTRRNEVEKKSLYLLTLDPTICAACADEMQNIEALAADSDMTADFFSLTVEFK